MARRPHRGTRRAEGAAMSEQSSASNVVAFPPGRIKRLNAAGAALSHALTHAQAGFAILPCSPGGRLLLGLKPDSATTDPTQIRAWWAAAPTAATAIPLGSASGVIAVEITGPQEIVGLLRAETERRLGKAIKSAAAAG